MSLYWYVKEDGLHLNCLVQPKASRDALVGIHDGRLKVQITAPPTDGKANAHLIKFIAKSVGVAKSRVHLLSGQSSRQKSLLIANIDQLPENFPRT